jgi:hypothetical protein
MVRALKLQEVAKLVHRDFRRLRRLPRFRSSSEFFKRTDSWRDNARVTLLAEFLQLNGCQLYILEDFKLPGRDFASWLFTLSGDTMRIVVDQKRLRQWARVSRLPLDVQKVRSILHELGHLQLSDTLKKGRKNRFTRSATAFEEERAWIYSMLFLALLMGDYARYNRTPPRFADDTPRLLI